jgi:glycosyltransferase involved in cell wall biosynthesis
MVGQLGARLAVIAYACHPDEGSEPGAGWAWLQEIALLRPVTLFTRATSDSRLEEEVAKRNLPIEVRRISTPIYGSAQTKLGTYLRYFFWLYLCRRALVKAVTSDRVSAAHHLTYASDWLPSPLAGLTIPTIWGPVGGASRSSRHLLKKLPIKHQVLELMRPLLSEVARATITRRTVKTANVCVAMNSDTHGVLESSGAGVVMTRPNVVIEFAPPTGTHAGDQYVVVYIGRVVEWKGLRFAIEALTDVRASGWRLDVYGAGPDQGRLKRLSENLGLENRVRFHGQVTRKAVEEALEGADALVLPSLHDSAGWAVAEASTMGVPCVVFDIGGVAVVAGTNGRIIDERDPSGSIAHELEKVASKPFCRTPIDTWSRSELRDFLSRLYNDALL